MGIPKNLAPGPNQALHRLLTVNGTFIVTSPKKVLTINQRSYRLIKL